MTGRHRRSRVKDKQWITPHIVRITVDCGSHYRHTGTDSHVALYFYPPEARVPPEFAADNLTALHTFASPQVRRYTVQRYDPSHGTVDLDFVVHEPAGLASTWARDAVIGDEVLWWGPTEAWHLPELTRTLILVADETGLPAVASILRELTEGAQAHVIALVDDRSDEAYLTLPLSATGAETHVTWIHRGPASGEPPAKFLRTLDDVADLLSSEPADTIALWSGTEFAEAGAVRRTLLRSRGPLDKANTNVTSYWIHGQAQDARPDARNRRRNLDNRARYPDEAAVHINPQSSSPVSYQSADETHW